MSLTKEEKQIIEYGKEKGKTFEQSLAALAQYRSEQANTPLQPMGFLAAVQDIPSDIKETVQGVGSSVLEGARTGDEAVDQVMSGEISPLAGTMKTIGGGLRAGARAIGETVMGAGKMFLSPGREEQIESAVQSVGETVMSTQAAQDLSELYSGLSPQQKAIFDGSTGIAEGVTTMFGLAPATRFGTKQAQSTLSRARQSVGELSSTVKEKISIAPPQVIRDLQRSLNPQTRKEAVDSITDAYYSGFVAENKTITNKLEALARKNSFGDIKIDEKMLLRELADDGYTPVVEGSMARMGHVIDDIEARRSAGAEAMIPFLETVPQLTNLDDLKSFSDSVIRRATRGAADLDKNLKENARIFESLRGVYGDTLSATDVHKIRVEMNSRTKAFNREIFEQDTADAIGDAARARMDEILPSGTVQQMNKEIGRLFTMEKTARILNNNKINVGLLGSQTGRYIAATALGASGIATGSGSLVIAGIAAQIGGDAFANMLRRRKFSPKVREMVINTVRSDEQVRNQLLKEASEANKQYLERLLLPAPTVRGQAPERSSVRAIPARKGEPGRTPAGQPEGGRFFGTFRSD